MTKFEDLGIFENICPKTGQSWCLKGKLPILTFFPVPQMYNWTKDYPHFSKWIENECAVACRPNSNQYNLGGIGCALISSLHKLTRTDRQADTETDFFHHLYFLKNSVCDKNTFLNQVWFIWQWQKSIVACD